MSAYVNVRGEKLLFTERTTSWILMVGSCIAVVQKHTSRDLLALCSI